MTLVNVVLDDLHDYFSMKQLERLISKFKCLKQKQPILYKCTNLGTISQRLRNLKFLGRLFVSENMSCQN